jgi:hypothetical protein
MENSLIYLFFDRVVLDGVVAILLMRACRFPRTGVNASAIPMTHERPPMITGL